MPGKSSTSMCKHPSPNIPLASPCSPHIPLQSTHRGGIGIMGSHMDSGTGAHLVYTYVILRCIKPQQQWTVGRDTPANAAAAAVIGSDSPYLLLSTREHPPTGITSITCDRFRLSPPWRLLQHERTLAPACPQISRSCPLPGHCRCPLLPSLLLGPPRCFPFGEPCVPLLLLESHLNPVAYGDSKKKIRLREEKQFIEKGTTVIGQRPLERPVLPCPALPCPAMSCPALPCPARLPIYRGSAWLGNC